MMRGVQVEALLALELFQLDPRSKGSRDLLHQYLVEVGLLEAKVPITGPEVMETVSQMCGSRSPLSEGELQAALERCVNRDSVVKNAEHRYVLSPFARAKLEDERIRHHRQKESFRDLVVERVERALKQALSTLAEPVLVAAVTRTLQALFYDNHIRLHRALSEGSDFGCLLESDFDPEQNLRKELEVFVTTHAPGEMETTVVGVKDALANLNSDHQEYLLRLVQQIFFFEILNLDPRLQDLERRCFERTHLYLDTNVGIRYISGHHPQHETISATIDTSKALGCQLFVSPSTLIEMTRLVSNARSHGAFLNQDRIRQVLSADPMAADNPLIETYISEKRGNPSLTWAAFIARYEDMESLLLAHDVLVSGDDATVLQAETSYSRASQAVSQVKADANPYVILRDTVNLVLVHKERQRVAPTAMGPGVWLLTVDHKLPLVDRAMRHVFQVGHCRLLDQWAEAIFPFQGIVGTSFTGDYVAFLVANRFGLYLHHSVVQTDFFKTLVDDQIGVPELLQLPPEVALGVVRALQEDREARKLVEESGAQVDEAELERRHEQLRDLIAKYAAEIEAEARRRSDEEIKRLKDGMAELQASLDLATKQQSEQDATLISGLENKIERLSRTVNDKEQTLLQREAALQETRRQLETERKVSWLEKLWRGLRGKP